MNDAGHDHGRREARFGRSRPRQQAGGESSSYFHSSVTTSRYSIANNLWAKSAVLKHLSMPLDHVDERCRLILLMNNHFPQLSPYPEFKSWSNPNRNYNPDFAPPQVIPLEELKRPRVDVVVNCSGVFRDLFVNQMNLLDRAVKLAAEQDEPDEMNFVRKHAREQVRVVGASVSRICIGMHLHPQDALVQTGCIWRAKRAVDGKLAYCQGLGCTGMRGGIYFASPGCHTACLTQFLALSLAGQAQVGYVIRATSHLPVLPSIGLLSISCCST